MPQFGAAQIPPPSRPHFENQPCGSVVPKSGLVGGGCVTKGLPGESEGLRIKARRTLSFLHLWGLDGTSSSQLTPREPPASRPKGQSPHAGQRSHDISTTQILICKQPSQGHTRRRLVFIFDLRSTGWTSHLGTGLWFGLSNRDFRMSHCACVVKLANLLAR